MEFLNKFLSDEKLLDKAYNYFYGIKGYQTDIAKAHKYLSILAHRGNEIAIKQLEIAFIPGTSEFTEGFKDIYPILKQLRHDVEQRNPEACYYYATTKFGSDTPDYIFKKAFEAMTIAAEQKHPRAMFALAIELLQGNRVEQNEAQGLELMRESAELGCLEAIHLFILHNGEDRRYAVDLLKKRVANKEVEYYELLGDVYYHYDQDIAKALSIYQEGADLGNANCMFNVAITYENGTHYERDLFMAAKWYKQAADLGETQSMINLANLLMTDKGDLYNPKAAMEWLDKAIAAGRDDALNDVGYFYKHGIGVEQSFDKALEAYLKAAESDNKAMAFYNLFMLYRDDVACPPDYKTSTEWLLKAAHHEYPLAMWHLAKHYQFGIGVEQDDEQYQYWLAEATKADEPHAMFEMGQHILAGNVRDLSPDKGIELITQSAKTLPEAMGFLGQCYTNGWGVERDLPQALLCYKTAAKAGDAQAQYDYAICLRQGEACDINIPEAIKWYNKAIEQGHSGAMVNCGILYDNAIGVERDLEKAFNLYIQAAELGNAHGQFNTGTFYLYGKYVDQDFEEAVKWFKLGAEQNEPDSILHLGLCYYQNQGVAENPENQTTGLKLIFQSADMGWQPAIDLIRQNNLARPQ